MTPTPQANAPHKGIDHGSDNQPEPLSLTEEIAGRQDHVDGDGFCFKARNSKSDAARFSAIGGLRRKPVCVIAVSRIELIVRFSNGSSE